VSPQDGVLDSLVLPEVSAATMSLFLAEVAQRHEEEFILMVLNQATKDWHSKVDSALSDSATYPHLEWFPLCHLLLWSPSPLASKRSFWRSCARLAMATC
jgi:hypothetical protein